MLAKNVNRRETNPKRVVIIGAGGFVSKNLASYLLSHKIKILEITREMINLTNQNSIKKISRQIKNNDTIFFAASKVPVKSEKMFNDNILMCKNLCFALKEKNLSHFIYLSSDAVYSDNFKRIKENFETKPDNLHGLMHLAREEIFAKYITAPYLIVRPTLIYGKDDPHNGYGPNRFRRLINKKININLFGKGEEKRDHIHIDDVSAIIYHSIINKTVGKINIASGRLLSFYEIALVLKKKYKSKIKIIFNKRIGKMPHNGFRALSNSIIKKLFNYKNFREII